jgi:hypothetical protein
MKDFILPFHLIESKDYLNARSAWFNLKEPSILIYLGCVRIGNSC